MYPNTYFVPPPFGPDFDFFQTLRGYVKFSVVLLLFVALTLILLWNIQPWFEIEIKTVDQTKDLGMKGLQWRTSGRALQTDIKFAIYVVQPGESLSEIAERYGVGVAALLKYNPLENPNMLRPGQRLRIPKRS